MPWDETRMSSQKNMDVTLAKRIIQDKEEIHIDLDLILEYEFCEIKLLVFPGEDTIVSFPSV